MQICIIPNLNIVKQQQSLCVTVSLLAELFIKAIINQPILMYIFPKTNHTNINRKKLLEIKKGEMPKFFSFDFYVLAYIKK